MIFFITVYSVLALEQPHVREFLVDNPKIAKALAKKIRQEIIKKK